MAPSISTILCLYRYDPLDRLASTQPVAQDNALRFYRKNRLATQIQGAIQHTFFGHDDQLLAQQQHSGKRTETSLLATDQQGSVLHGIDGAGIESRAYNAYGHHPAESGLSCLMGFNGEQRDPVTGHYLLGNGYRAFNPVLMRFNSPDELSPFGRGGLNAYAYCQGDPVNFRDATGKMPYRLIEGTIDTLSSVPTAIVRPSHVDDELMKVLDLALDIEQDSLNVSVSRSLSPPVAQASTFASAMQAGPSTSRGVASTRDSLLQAIKPETMSATEFRHARDRISGLKKRGALDGKLTKRPNELRRRIEALENGEKSLRAIIGHYKVPSNLPIGRYSLIDGYLDKIISIRQTIPNLQRELKNKKNSSIMPN